MTFNKNWAKASIRKLFLMAGLSVSRNSGRGGPAAKIPESNFENVSLVMECFTGKRTGGVFVQVGANDGKTSDSVYPFVKRGIMTSVLIEPVPQTFEKLQSFYRNVPRVHLLNAAIGTTNGKQKIYAVKNSGRWKDNSWASQLASFDREHLLRHSITENEIEDLEVDVITLAKLVRDFEIAQIDVLQIDVEGFDHEIVKAALALPSPPKFICFEYVQFVNVLPQNEVNQLFEELGRKGYRWVKDRINVVAIHREAVPTGVQEKPE